LHLILDNKKSIDLELTNLFLIYQNNNVESYPLGETLKGNEILAMDQSINNTDFLTGEIKTHCPDVSVYFTKSQVS